MRELAEYFFLGGILMWVLLGCSIVGVAVILERGVIYLRYGLNSDRWLGGVLRDLRGGDVAGVLGRAGQCRHPVARVVEVYLGGLERSAGIRRENVKRAGSLELERVEKRLRVLAAIAHIAPLVGLLGTVAGMVVAFAEIQALQGTVRPSDLAGGIWEALLTTVFGLAIAIPCMAAFHAYESHADKIARRMEWAVSALDDVLDVGGGIPGEAAQGGGPGVENEDQAWASIG